MKRAAFTTIGLASMLALAACGNTTGDRAISGGGIGAGVGALGGLIVGAPLEGALIGGAVGAGTGALTRRDQIDLGRPIWR
ncbi:YMGG-like glycine zipper-containing protein [Elioraea sp.]|uniref:YMGG-like glycine zipper-containing protein n=1 Tax=Elioraea sp. TaxID=2185103 RepID=UPI003F72BFE0